LLKINQIYFEDCLDGMRKIDKNSIDMVLCDLPYGTTQNSWDSIIPLSDLWEQYLRITKDNAAIVLTAMQPFTSILVCSNLKMFKYDWIWQKPKGTGHLNAKRQPMRDKEDILVFYKKQCKYNPQMTLGTPYKDKAGKDHSSKSSMTGSYGDYTNFRNDNTGFRYPKQVQQFPVVERGTLHPTQKPLELFEYLIKTYTNESDIVLDNCMGSGTTAIACINTNRNYIGFENDPKYYEIAQKRIENTQKVMKSDEKT
jgi:DNA modification methylase